MSLSIFNSNAIYESHNNSKVKTGKLNVTTNV